jgi:hypothetical protein
MKLKSNEAATQAVHEIERLNDDGEKYIVLLKAADRRVAVIARKDGGEVTFTLEVQLRLVTNEQGRELSFLTSMAEETALLLSKGYAAGKQEEAWVCCEKQVDIETLARELDGVMDCGREY